MASSGTYCPACGEEMEPALPTVKHYLRELSREFVELDSKLVRTVPALFRPGFLMKEYTAGRRQRYMKPLRLYLLIGIVFFLFFGSMAKEKIQRPLPSHSGVLNLAVNTSNATHARQNGVAILTYVTEIAPYTILIFSAPLLALSLKILYGRRRLYVEHIIFSYYVCSLALIVFAPGVSLDSGDLTIAGLTAFLIYLFVAMRRVYADRGVALFLRFVTTTVAYFCLMALSLAISLGAAYIYGVLTGVIPKGASVYL
ncbi:MAG: DUF3667 domain-containing protein [Bacteroidota bacterium]|nr:DUF3667 domain-containing protein [Bacteroidota bacterium]